MPKRILNGVVVSDKNDKTIVVEVERRFTHPLLKKTVRRSKKYQAHDEDNTFKTGDKVRIQESAPICATSAGSRSSSRVEEISAERSSALTRGSSHDPDGIKSRRGR